MYEPGSTFKLQTASMALDGGIVHIWDEFDAAHPIHIGRFTITDFEGKHRWLYLPEVLAYSSNLGAAHIAVDVGAERQRAWLKKMGMFSRVADPVAGSRPADRPAGGQLEGGDDDDGGLRPRHLGLAAARGARHRGGGQRRHPGAPDDPGVEPRAGRGAAGCGAGHAARDRRPSCAS